jgi:hypothetical protein
MLHFLLIIMALGGIVVLATISRAFRAFIFILIAIFGLILWAVLTSGKKTSEESERENAASKRAAEYALAASTTIKRSDLLFEDVILSKTPPSFGMDEFAVSGSVTNNSNARLSSVHFDVTLTDCLKSKCIVVGQNSVTVFIDIPAGQKRAFTSRAMTFENLPAAGAATRSWKYDIGEIRADLRGG